MAVIPDGHEQRLAFFRELAHQVHIGRCTRAGSPTKGKIMTSSNKFTQGDLVIFTKDDGGIPRLFNCVGEVAKINAQGDVAQVNFTGCTDGQWDPDTPRFNPFNVSTSDLASYAPPTYHAVE